MKRFRWGDVVPGCGSECCNHEDEILEQAGVYAAAEHGLRPVDSGGAEVIRRYLELVD